MYLLGVINSNFLNWFFKKNCLTNEQSIAQVKTVDLVKLPIRTINLSDPADKSRHDRMVFLVAEMLAAKKQLAVANTDRDKDFYKTKCNSLDHKIDALVWQLYDLSAEEIELLPPRDQQ